MQEIVILDRLSPRGKEELINLLKRLSTSCIENNLYKDASIFLNVIEYLTRVDILEEVTLYTQEQVNTIPTYYIDTNPEKIEEGYKADKLDEEYIEEAEENLSITGNFNNIDKFLYTSIEADSKFKESLFSLAKVNQLNPVTFIKWSRGIDRESCDLFNEQTLRQPMYSTYSNGFRVHELYIGTKILLKYINTTIIICYSRKSKEPIRLTTNNLSEVFARDIIYYNPEYIRKSEELVKKASRPRWRYLFDRCIIYLVAIHILIKKGGNKYEISEEYREYVNKEEKKEEKEIKPQGEKEEKPVDRYRQSILDFNSKLEKQTPSVVNSIVEKESIYNEA